jgi:heme exporter protein C
MKWWQGGLFIWMAATIVAGFVYAPLARKLYEYTRIIYFHIPAAWVSLMAFFVAGIEGARYLWKRDPMADLRSAAAARLGLVFCALATVTGMLFAKAMWGEYWNWDPRQVTIFFLLLIYAAYLTLRAAVDDPERRARVSAVYAILAAVTAPFLMFVLPRLSEFTLHPEPIVNGAGKLEMHPRMFGVFLSSTGAFTALFFWILSLEVRAARARLASRPAAPRVETEITLDRAARA